MGLGLGAMRFNIEGARHHLASALSHNRGLVEDDGGLPRTAPGLQSERPRPHPLPLMRLSLLTRAAVHIAVPHVAVETLPPSCCCIWFCWLPPCPGLGFRPQRSQLLGNPGAFATTKPCGIIAGCIGTPPKQATCYRGVSGLDQPWDRLVAAPCIHLH